MSTLVTPEIVKRLAKGSPLTVQEMDDNFCNLADFITALAGLITEVIGTDGKLADCTVDTDSLCDRIVTQRKLSDTSAFYASDTSGAADALEIAFDPAFTSYAEGQVVFVKVANTNTGAATLNINSLGATVIKKHANETLHAGDLEAGKIAILAYNGSEFRLLNPSKYPQDAVSLYESVASSALSSGANQEVFTHGLVDNNGDPVEPTGFNAFLVCQLDDVSGYFTTGDKIPLGNLLLNSADEEGPITVSANDTSIKVSINLPSGRNIVSLPDLSTMDGVATRIDVTKWKIGVKAWYFNPNATSGVNVSTSSSSSSSSSSNLVALSQEFDIPSAGAEVVWGHGQSGVPTIVQARLVVKDASALPSSYGDQMEDGDELEFLVTAKNIGTPATSRIAAPMVKSGPTSIKFRSPANDTSGTTTARFQFDVYDALGQLGATHDMSVADAQTHFYLKLSAVWTGGGS